MIPLLLAAGLAVMAGTALAGCAPLCARALAGASAPGRARCTAAAFAGGTLVSVAGLAFLAIPTVLRVLPAAHLAAWPALVSGAGAGLWAAAGPRS